MNTMNKTMISDTEYVNLSLELTGKIFSKSFPGFLKFKEDMIQQALLQVCEAINKFDKNKGDIKKFIASIIYNSYKTYIRDNVYKDKDILTSLDINVNYEEEKETTLLETIGNIDVEYQNIECIELLKEFDNVIEMRNINKFNKINTEELHMIINLLIEGYNKSEIAKTLNVSNVTINRKIKIIKSIIEEIKNN